MMENRRFPKGDYELEFSKKQSIESYFHRGIVIYSYLNILETKSYTFWCSSINSDYISSVNNLEEAKKLINKNIEIGAIKWNMKNLQQIKVLYVSSPMKI